MVDEAATWSSFSGSLSKTAKVRKSVPSIRGPRYFGPSKMSFIDLLKHSLTIIAVFKFTVIIRSIIYILKQTISERFFFVILNGEQSYL